MDLGELVTLNMHFVSYCKDGQNKLISKGFVGIILGLSFKGHDYMPFDLIIAKLEACMPYTAFLINYY